MPSRSLNPSHPKTEQLAVSVTSLRKDDKLVHVNEHFDRRSQE
jgi:hypothetical protein